MANPQTPSPVTGIIEEELVIVDFGRHEGKSVQSLQEADKDFYDFLVRERESGKYSIRRHRDKSFRLFLNPLVPLESLDQ